MSARNASAGGSWRTQRLRLGLVLTAFLGACGSTGPRPIPDTRSRYDVFANEDRAQFDAARRDMQAGRHDSARDVLAALQARLPDHLVVGVWLQEAEIALADPAFEAGPAANSESGAPAPATIESAAAYEALRQRYRRAAEAEPTVAHLVLAARLESDIPAAMLLLDRAEELDADCAWIHYGRAFLAARDSDWPQVRVWIARASEADPGHLPTRWLEAWMLAQGGNVDEAIAALEVWLARARGDLRLDPRLVRGAELDLAILCVLDGDPQRARKILSELGDDGLDPARKLAVVACTEQALGDFEQALAAAHRAEALAPGAILPVVQQALLYDTWLEDPAAAEAAWTRVLAISRASPDLSTLLERMRARVRLERFQERREKARSVSALTRAHGTGS